MRRCLEHIPEDARRQYGISDFDIKEAASVADAEKILTENASHPFDLVLLDLRLPKTYPGDGTEDMDNGHNLLKFIEESRTSKGVIIVSAFPEYDNVTRGFRGGALDFIPKPFFQEHLQPPVLNALWRIMTKESEAIFNQRIRDFVAYAERGLVHSFREIFIDLLKKVREVAEGIEKYARERYAVDLEKNPNDMLLLKLRAHQKVVNQANDRWGKLQAELAPGDTSMDCIYVEDELSDIKKSLLPVLAVKKVMFDPPPGNKKVITFEKDVHAVMREIIVGLLNALPGNEENYYIKVTISEDDSRAAVRFEDSFRPIAESDREAINSGQRIIPDANFGRVWGLSVAQHVALRGGGELKVTSERGKNIITYYIPLADYE
jgi:CheY-like chemotaxis protein